MFLSHKRRTEANDIENGKGENDEACLARAPTSALSWARVKRAQLISCCSTSGCQDAPEPTQAPPRCGLRSPIGASVKQAYYSYPEGVLSLLTGRHKYSSISSPRVNGCPSDCSEPYSRTECLLQMCGVGTFVATARSFTKRKKPGEPRMQSAKTNSSSSPRTQSQNTP